MARENQDFRARRRRLAEAYLERHRDVEGWLDDTTARVTDHLLQAQSELGITGNVLEIGVHHGRYFIVLANGLADGESAVAVDLFADQQLNISQSGKGSWTAFVWNVARFAPLTPVAMVQANSTDLGDEFIAARQGMRFVSIDGGHDRATTCADLWLAERLATTGAIVALDDIYRPDWSGVTAGLARYFAERGG
ncbi:MAG: class I SAM-dependent methyltransferase, partial [Thermomicrobiales bacterium]